MDTEYLKNSIGKCLVEGLAEVVEQRPMDPIEFLAQWIYKYRENRDYERERKAYQRELDEARAEAERRRKMREEEEEEEQRVHQEKSKPEQSAEPVPIPENSVGEPTQPEESEERVSPQPDLVEDGASAAGHPGNEMQAGPSQDTEEMQAMAAGHPGEEMQAGPSQDTEEMQALAAGHPGEEMQAGPSQDTEEMQALAAGHPGEEMQAGPSQDTEEMQALAAGHPGEEMQAGPSQDTEEMQALSELGNKETPNQERNQAASHETTPVVGTDAAADHPAARDGQRESSASANETHNSETQQGTESTGADPDLATDSDGLRSIVGHLEIQHEVETSQLGQVSSEDEVKEEL
ncbi:DPY30 domain containing 2 isoform X1 [Brienomyrus brachyistius]|uniref:DPY30 domain containing 2 isoform X1 n=1 Tax=Brienomyrus brachyistius TaxID=42636 RepID=UPI0020B30CE2|nr:DPY30 domain containing 2 isoform X1 [Brienomyrus brachyistius]XP_048842622.1 DPY30 domain containing 2 isoform X1 [Brienomyrus brachyistius]XP_048842623.1 DPY30 domain containing 2 isoform X1 [Brienomyrus brachyistius]